MRHVGNLKSASTTKWAISADYKKKTKVRVKIGCLCFLTQRKLSCYYYYYKENATLFFYYYQSTLFNLKIVFCQAYPKFSVAILAIEHVIQSKATQLYSCKNCSHGGKRTDTISILCRYVYGLFYYPNISRVSYTSSVNYDIWASQTSLWRRHSCFIYFYF